MTHILAFLLLVIFQFETIGTKTLESKARIMSLHTEILRIKIRLLKYYNNNNFESRPYLPKG